MDFDSCLNWIPSVTISGFCYAELLSKYKSSPKPCAISKLVLALNSSFAFVMWKQPHSYFFSMQIQMLSSLRQLGVNVNSQCCQSQIWGISPLCSIALGEDSSMETHFITMCVRKHVVSPGKFWHFPWAQSVGLSSLLLNLFGYVNWRLFLELVLKQHTNAFSFCRLVDNDFNFLGMIFRESTQLQWVLQRVIKAREAQTWVSG